MTPTGPHAPKTSWSASIIFSRKKHFLSLSFSISLTSNAAFPRFFLYCKIKYLLPPNPRLFQTKIHEESKTRTTLIFTNPRNPKKKARTFRQRPRKENSIPGRDVGDLQEAIGEVLWCWRWWRWATLAQGLEAPLIWGLLHRCGPSQFLSRRPGTGALLSFRHVRRSLRRPWWPRSFSLHHSPSLCFPSQYV